MAYNTGNALGSTDARDLYDNAVNLDTAVNSMASRWTDRLGVSRPTWSGMVSYADVGAYTAGIEVTGYNEIFLHEGEYYRAAASTTLPYITTGSWSDDGVYFISVGDAVLRQELATTADIVIGAYRNAVNCNQYGGLQLALANSDTLGKIIVVTDAQSITDDVTVTDRAVACEFSTGIITIASGKTLTINGPFSCGLYQCFDGDGSVVFGAGSITQVPPEWFGGDCNSALAAFNKVVLSKGETYTGDVNITKSNVEITGGGTIAGKVYVTGADISNRLTDIKLHNFNISFTSFLESATDAWVANSDIYDAITLSYVSGVTISAMYFHGCRRAITTVPITTDGDSQSVRRLLISNNRFRWCTSNLWSETTAASSTRYTLGDVQLINNQMEATRENHIYCVGVDGLVAQGNTMFFPGSSQHQAYKNQNIFIDTGFFIAITGNNLFEAGKEGVYLNKVRDFIISNNNIAWCGQREERSGIRVSGGDVVGSAYVFGTISDNNIEYPSKHGIEITSPSGYVKVSGGWVKLSSANTGYDFYYGTGTTIGPTATPSLTSAHNAVYADSGTSYVSVDDVRVLKIKSSTYEPFDLTQASVASNRVAGYKDYGTITYYQAQPLLLAFSAGETVLDVTGASGINLVNSSATTISQFTTNDAYTTRFLTVLSLTANSTIKQKTGGSENIQLKSSINVTMPAAGVMQFYYTSGTWYEAGRSF